MRACPLLLVSVFGPKQCFVLIFCFFWVILSWHFLFKPKLWICLINSFLMVVHTFAFFNELQIIGCFILSLLSFSLCLRVSWMNSSLWLLSLSCHNLIAILPSRKINVTTFFFYVVVLVAVPTALIYMAKYLEI